MLYYPAEKEKSSEKKRYPNITLILLYNKLQIQGFIIK
jgi:hypothetical protein